MQAIFHYFGGTVSFAGEIVHGKTSTLKHDSKGLYLDLPQSFNVTRYHSLAPVSSTCPDELEVSSTCVNLKGNGVIIQGIRHKQFTIEGVQFHPESIASEYGQQMFQNFLNLDSGSWKQSKTPSILTRIYNQRKEYYTNLQKHPGKSFKNLQESYKSILPIPKKLIKQGLIIMAEVKRASPSKGDISLNATATSISIDYAISKVDVISVLTDPNFKGDLQDLLFISQSLKSLPNPPLLLRKDFIFCKYQILESVLSNADIILLIVKMLSIEELSELIEYSRLLGIEPLVEVTSITELKTAISLNSTLIGINNRDLHSFNVDLSTTKKLNLNDYTNVTFISLSGITCRNDVLECIENGCHGVLVGEAIMKSDNSVKFINELKGIDILFRSSLDYKVKVKICGVMDVNDALNIAALNPDFIGLIFADSRRRVSVKVARDIVNAITSRYGILDKSTGLFPLGVKIVGVFRNMSLNEINSIAKETGIDYIQLHGSETADFASLCCVPVIKAISITSNSDTLLEMETFKDQTKICLFDSPKDLGGVSFDWDIASKIKNQGYILAGGLNPENVVEAIEKCNPFGVDVCSGVENADGKKDLEKVRVFIDLVRGKEAIA